VLVVKLDQLDQSVKLVGGCSNADTFVPVSYKRRLFIPKGRL
jgi:hypothetical protein